MQFCFDKKFSNKPLATDDAGLILDYESYSLFKEKFSGVVEPRSLIFIYCRNSCEALAAFLACLEGDIVPLLLDSKLNPELRIRLEETYEPNYVWAPAEEDQNLSHAVLSWHGYSLCETGTEKHSLHKDLALLLTTSGSTGSPKLVRHSYANVFANAANVAKAFRIEPSDKPLAFLPLHYTMGLSLVCSHLIAGATVRLTEKAITDAEFWKCLKEEQVTNLTGIPFSFLWFKKLRLERMHLPYLNVLSQGGGKLDNALFKDFATFCEQNGKRFIASYGQTESTARMSLLEPEFALQKAGSIGKPIPNGLFRLKLDDGSYSTEGEASGELVYEGPNVTLGYAYGKQDLAKGDERNGMLHTNDMAYRDEDGFYYITGRKSRFLKIYGIRISMDEVESLVSAKFEADCMVTGKDDLMQIIIAGEFDTKEVKTYISQKLNLNHAALSVSVTDEIKRNSAGKVIYNSKV